MYCKRPQIREQMCLETHFQYEFSFLGRFGQSGRAAEKKVQTVISMLLLRPVFYIFMGKKYLFSKYPNVRTEAIKNGNFFIKKITKNKQFNVST